MSKFKFNSIPQKCGYCGSKVALVNAKDIYVDNMNDNDYLYMCTSCDSSVGCYKDTKKPLGALLSERDRDIIKERDRLFAYHWRKDLENSMGYSDFQKKLSRRNNSISTASEDDFLKTILFMKHYKR